MRVLVCGGRNFNNKGLVFSTLDEIHKATPVTLVIHGGASGADTLAGEWAAQDIPTVVFDADWAKLGRRAGPIRNRRMLQNGKPNLVVAFPGGAGTAHMASIAEEAGVHVLRVVE